MKRQNPISFWAERVAGLPWDHPLTTTILAECKWDNYWPVVDKYGLLTGEVVESSDAVGMVNIADVAMVYREDTIGIDSDGAYGSVVETHALMCGDDGKMVADKRLWLVGAEGVEWFPPDSELYTWQVFAAARQADMAVEINEDEGYIYHQDNILARCI